MSAKIRTDTDWQLKSYFMSVPWEYISIKTKHTSQIKIALESIKAPLEIGADIWVYKEGMDDAFDLQFLKFTPLGFRAYSKSTIGHSSAWFSFKDGYMFSSDEKTIRAIQLYFKISELSKHNTAITRLENDIKQLKDKYFHESN